jgi:tetratricopeptide (TPR) repeat protein
MIGSWTSFSARSESGATSSSVRRSFDPALELSYTAAWCTLGDIDEDLGHFRESWTEFSRCTELARAQLQRKRDTGSLNQVQQATSRMATAAQSMGLLTEALQALDESESVMRELLADQPHNPVLHRRQALLHQFRSSVYYDDINPDLRDPARALESAKRYLEAAQQMVTGDPNNASAQFSRAIAMFRVSYSLREFDAPAAVRMARDSVRIFDELIASGKTNSLIVSRRVTALRRLAEAQLKSGLPRDARISAESALAKERIIAGQTAADSEEHAMLVRALTVAAEACARSGEVKRAESLLQEARVIAEPVAQNATPANIRALADTEEALGAFYARRRPAEARACYEHLLEVWQRLPGPNEYVDRQRTAASRLLASVQ